MFGIYEFVEFPKGENSDDIELNWSVDEPETMISICPELYKLCRK